MSIKIHMLTLGVVRTHCYILGDTQTNEAIVIDPADSAPTILGILHDEGWQLKEILATHTHFDHILAAGELKGETGASFRIHELELEQLHLMPQITERLIGQAASAAPEPDGFVSEGDKIQVGAIALEVLFTPGHSRGHVSYVCHDQAVVFSGDCLFKGTIGLTDIPGADRETLLESITEKLMPLYDDYTVACGHGHNTTIGQERQSNPYLLAWIDSYGGQL